MKDQLIKAISDVLQDLGIEAVDFVVEHPAELAHGDYATNVALVLYSKLVQQDFIRKQRINELFDYTWVSDSGEWNFKSPRELAELMENVLKTKISNIESIDIAGPGFINFHLKRDFFSEKITHINQAGERWGTNDSWKDKVVIVEYTDPNPFKELHIGHLVPNALGESLARLFMVSGATTKRVTFQGDVGMHVAKAMYGLLNIGNLANEKFTPSDLGDAYVFGAIRFENDEQAAADIKALNKTIYQRSDDAVNALYDYGKQVSLAYFEKAYAILGSAFDYNFMESVTGPVGLELVKAHVGDVFEESNGAIIFKGEDYGLHTRVFVNAEGLPTYEAKDMGLVVEKERWSQEVTGQSFDLTITVTGTEQQEYFKVTTKASELVQPAVAGKVELVPNGMLRLKEGKMSSRTGQVVRALSMIDDVKQAALSRMAEASIAEPAAVAEQVAVAAIKYTILKIAAGKDIVFDLKQSISFEGDSGPYLQYTVARINSVLEKAVAAGVAPGVEVAPALPYSLERIVYQYPEVIEEALAERAPHKLVTYLTELAGAFNTFYAQEKIADASDELAPYKATLTKAVGQTLQNGLWVLGIEAPDRM